MSFILVPFCPSAAQQTRPAAIHFVRFMLYKVSYQPPSGNPRAHHRISHIRVVAKTPKPAKPVELRCARCNHVESEHGKTGFRPCLAMVGDLVTREFCACD